MAGPCGAMMMLRLLPTILLPAPMPCVLAGTEVEVLSLWASITQAEVWRFLPFLLAYQLP